MNYQDYIIEAADMVSAWEVPDSALPQAIQAQAELMAGLDYHWHETPDQDRHHHSNPC